MPKLTVTLKQHTPLIHFQGNQSGATIRATEFKPKLDKFLKENAFKGGFEEYKQYLIGYNDTKKEEDFEEKEAFNYKIKFYNMKNLKAKKVQQKYKLNFNTVDIEIFSFYKELINKIIEILPLFLESDCFGSKQSKGNGALRIDEDNKYFLDGKEFKFNREKKERKVVKNKNGISKKNNNKRKHKGFGNIKESMDPLILKKLEELKNNYNNDK